MTERGIWNKILKKAPTNARLTPSEILRIIIVSGTPFICPASTIKSGSAIVIKAPMKKVKITINNSFLVFTNVEPICFPMGIRDTSTPRLNNVIPIITTKALTRNSTKFHDGIGAIV